MLNLLKIEYLKAGISHENIRNSDINSLSIQQQIEKDIIYLQDWKHAQENVKRFNQPDIISSILLTTKYIFQPPSITPQQADIVIILSESWSIYFDLKHILRNTQYLV